MAENKVVCGTCSGRGVCAPFYCYPCARGDHDEHKLAWVPDIPCECPEHTTPPAPTTDPRAEEARAQLTDERTTR